MDAPLLEVFKVRLHGSLIKLIEVEDISARGRGFETDTSSNICSNPNLSMVLGFR